MHSKNMYVTVMCWLCKLCTMRIIFQVSTSLGTTNAGVFNIIIAMKAAQITSRLLVAIASTQYD